MDDEVEVYSEGIFYMSVCSALTPEETEARIRASRESGTRNGWRLSKDETFRSGAKNGCECPDQPGRRHFLFVC